MQSAFTLKQIESIWTKSNNDDAKQEIIDIVNEHCESIYNKSIDVEGFVAIIDYVVRVVNVNQYFIAHAVHQLVYKSGDIALIRSVIDTGLYKPHGRDVVIHFNKWGDNAREIVVKYVYNELLFCNLDEIICFNEIGSVYPLEYMSIVFENFDEIYHDANIVMMDSVNFRHDHDVNYVVHIMTSILNSAKGFKSELVINFLRRMISVDIAKLPEVLAHVREREDCVGGYYVLTRNDYFEAVNGIYNYLVTNRFDNSIIEFVKNIMAF